MEVLDESRVPVKGKEGDELNRYWIQKDIINGLNIFVLRGENPIARFSIFVGAVAGPSLIYIGMNEYLNNDRVRALRAPLLGVILIWIGIKGYISLQKSKVIYSFDENQISVFQGGKCIEHYAKEDIIEVFVREKITTEGLEYWVSVKTTENPANDLLLMTKGKEAVDVIDGVPVLKTEADQICKRINACFG